MNPIQEYFYRIEEPERSTFFFTGYHFSFRSENITETFSFGLPFIKYKRKCCVISITAKI
jgi:hypothetical protein